MKNLSELSKKEFDSLKESGMLWEIYEEAPEKYWVEEPLPLVDDRDFVNYYKSKRCGCEDDPCRGKR